MNNQRESDMKGVFLDLGSLDNQDLDFSMVNDLPVSWQYHASTSHEEIITRLQAVEIAVTNKVVLDADTLSRLPDLKLIAVAATGVNNVDLAAARERDIQVCNVTGYATPSVVQHVFMLILCLLRRLPAYTAALKQGRWQQSEHFCLLDYRIEELQDMALGIIGYGELGQAVAGMAQAFGMSVQIAQRDEHDTRPDRIPLVQLLQQSDIISLHCPLTKETSNLIGAEQLALMKPHALLINTARGGIVDEDALYQALLGNQIGGAGIDVLSIEPPTSNQPLLQAPMDNLIVTPHIAWASRGARQRLVNQLAKNLASYVQGKPLTNRVM